MSEIIIDLFQIIHIKSNQCEVLTGIAFSEHSFLLFLKPASVQKPGKLIFTEKLFLYHTWPITFNSISKIHEKHIQQIRSQLLFLKCDRQITNCDPSQMHRQKHNGILCFKKRRKTGDKLCPFNHRYFLFFFLLSIAVTGNYHLIWVNLFLIFLHLR